MFRACRSWNRRQLLLVLTVFAVVAPAAPAQVLTSFAELTAVPPSGSTNRLEFTVTLPDILGGISSSDTSDVSGTLDAELAYDLVGTTPVFNGLTLTGGRVFLTDMTLDFLLGLVTITTQGMSGVPGTPAPPGAVVAGTFNGSSHQIAFDQGTIVSSGLVVDTRDLSVEPSISTGSDTGTIEILGTTLNGPTATYDVALTLPVSSIDTDIVNNITVELETSGSVRAEGSFTVVIPEPATGAMIAGCLMMSLRPRRR